MRRNSDLLTGLLILGVVMAACSPTAPVAPPEVASPEVASGPTPSEPAPSAVPSPQQAHSPEPLALQVLLPEDGSQINIEQCQVIGTTEPGAVVSVNDELLIAGADGTFQTTIALEPGPNLIEVVASNSSGSEAFAQLTVTYQP